MNQYDKDTFLKVCEKLKTLSFDEVSQATMEDMAKYMMIPSDKHKESLLAAAQALLLRNLLDTYSAERLFRDMTFIHAFKTLNN